MECESSLPYVERRYSKESGAAFFFVWYCYSVRKQFTFEPSTLYFTVCAQLCSHLRDATETMSKKDNVLRSALRLDRYCLFLKVSDASREIIRLTSGSIFSKCRLQEEKKVFKVFPPNFLFFVSLVC